MSSSEQEKSTAMSVCIGVNNSYAGSETGKKPTESVSISMIPTQLMDVVQTATLVLPGVLGNTIDPFRQRKHTTVSYAL